MERKKALRVTRNSSRSILVRAKLIVESLPPVGLLVVMESSASVD